ncbi:hypothetical protein F0562_029774 [Nyssa sinensis]|uniref:Myb-related protein 123 n=1 Tax=Nyssa sinensis TaxID=561372 RepID=A0A5J5AWP7_9ASTE|nr:hypothetical protein F0562_029774 [Nyssa sinensis]
MGRSPCCAKEGLNRGAWTATEDKILTDYIKVHGEGRWRNLPKKAGLKRCGKSCRLRWLNYLRPDIKRGNISHDEEELIVRLHKLLGNRWSLIAGRLPGRTDNEIKNYWNTNLGKKVHDHHKKKEKMKKSKASLVMTPKMEITRPENESNVVKSKAMKCSKVFFGPQTQNIEPIDTTTVTAAGQSMVQNTSNFTPIPSGSPNGASSSTDLDHDQEDHGSDFMMNVNMGEFCLSDLLNADFIMPK